MCLSKITNWCKKDEGYGYKVYLKQDRVLTSPIQGDQVLTDQWMKRDNIPKKCHYNKCNYDHGFHLYKDKTDAEYTSILVGMINYINQDKFSEYIIVKKVKYKGLIVSGHEYNFFGPTVLNYPEVIVADQIYVPSDELIEESKDSITASFKHSKTQV